MRIAKLPVQRPLLITSICVIFSVGLALLAAIPSLWPESFPQLNGLKVDTDPENMLSPEEEVRVFHNQMLKEFSLNEIIVLGVSNRSHADGVFNVETLGRLNQLVDYAKTLRWPDEKSPRGFRGVLGADILAPSTVDRIEQDGPGQIRFEWLMKNAPQTREEALALREKALNIPMLKESMVAEKSNKAICVYIPVTEKSVSYEVSTALKNKIAEFTGGNDEFFITGLPVANDTFGVEMFIQMAVSAPLAMLVIFLLMLWFFKKPVLILSPMLVAMLSVMATMGLLIATGHTVHIMSSMIPIFIMPIAVLDSVHILSEFFDRYKGAEHRRETITEVMTELFMPMLYTSLTSVAGFASLALTHNPPVQVFGIFVACGVGLAWLFTILVVPAYIMLIPQSWMKGFGHREGVDRHDGVLFKILALLRTLSTRRSKIVIVLTVFLIVFAAMGIHKIRVNDNPVMWFTPSHPIRQADRILNENFAGTYMAHIAILPDPNRTPIDPSQWSSALASVTGLTTVEVQFIKASKASDLQGWEDCLYDLEEKMDERDPQVMTAVFSRFEQLKNESSPFRDPQVLGYVEDLEKFITSMELVGKVNGLPDIIKTVYRDLLGGGEEHYRLPESSVAVTQSLMQYQSSHRPQDLWHFVTPDYRKSTLWLQLKSGNNMDMKTVVDSVEAWVKTHPLPTGLEMRWFGLNYINVVWQEQMVSGMRDAFIGSFLVVFMMMVFLFRSALWGILSMIPLSVTIATIYGLVGWMGKDYDMPIAVLSSLTLGLAVDFAIHFLARSRELIQEKGSWEEASRLMFGEPAQAIGRNIVVIAVGFTPLLAAPLMPYKTVGVFMATIMLLAGVTTILLLPALMTFLVRPLEASVKQTGSFWSRPLDVAVGFGALFAAILFSAKEVIHISVTIVAIASFLAGILSVVASVLISKIFKPSNRGVS